MSRSTCNRADLVRVLSAQTSLLPVAADMLGYRRIVRATLDEKVVVRDRSPVAVDSSLVSKMMPTIVSESDWPDAQASSSFWLPFHYQQRQPLAEDLPQEGSELTWRGCPTEAPIWNPIADWRSIIPRLRSGLTDRARSSRVDVEEAVRRLAGGELIHEVPRQVVRRWGDRVQLIVDRSEHLIPFRADQAYFLEHLEKLLPHAAIQLAIYDEVRQQLRSIHRNQPSSDFRLPEPSVPIIILSDLGALRNTDRSTIWMDFAARCAQRGDRTLAVVPCSPKRVPRQIRTSIQVIPWQKLALARSCEDHSSRTGLVDRLFQMLAPTKRVEPGLLRAVRRTIEQAADASLESEFWQDSRLSSRHSQAASLDHDRLPDFRQLPRNDRSRVLQIVRQWRQPLDAEVWIGEIWGLDEESEALLSDLDREDAKRWQAALAAQQSNTMNDALLAWLARTTSGLTPDALQRQKHLRHLHRRIHEHDELLGGDPQELPSGSEFEVAVGQRGESLIFAKSSERRDDPRLHSLGSLRSTNGALLVCAEDEESGRRSFWKSGQPPSWASDWGRDKYGAWVEFEVEDPSFLLTEDEGFLLTEDGGRILLEQSSTIVQRMRWIPPGKFLMGSHDDEAGRWADEEPQHEVTLTRGYWMFDTPVTQQMWQAVMGENASRFKGDRRPVENVSWEETQQFLSKLNERLGETPFVLPTEAQWEYACRAGTTTPYAFGDELTSEQARFSVSVEAGTSAVGSYDPNRWGLFDMHGNVLEWCQDYWADDYSGAAATDPTGPSRGDDRVLRGGSWFNDAWYVRSADRSRNVSGYRFGSIGFRCAQVQGADEEDGRAAEPLAHPTNDGAAAALKIDTAARQQTPIPAGHVIIVRSDVDSLELRKIPKPDWASAIGRDRYGLWAEFTVDAQADATSQEASRRGIVQRMRWIPPGRFLMGSPAGDEMAYDFEKPQHEVTLSHGYWLFDTPVTQQFWLAVMNENPSRFLGTMRPVEQVSWEECQTFLQRINEAVRNLNLTLPTEAEWEYACRAGTITRYAFGDRITRDQANYSGGEQDQRETSNVKSFAPNGWGLFDIYGNVWEWCQDYWSENYKNAAALNPNGPSRGRYRVLRGGCWRDNARNVRSAYRYFFDPDYGYDDIGFRCAQVQESSRE